MAWYVDPSLSGTGGKGTISLPYTLLDLQTAIANTTNPLNWGGLPILFKSGTFGRLTSTLTPPATASNLSLGVYGTGAKPILSGTALNATAWTVNATYPNIWQTPHVNDDRWFVGGSPSNNAVVSAVASAYSSLNVLNNPYGTSLQKTTSVALVASTPFSYYNDGVNAYVNLSGSNPNNLVMEYSSIQRCFNLTSTQGNFYAESLRFAGAYDDCFFLQFSNTLPLIGSYTLKHLEIDSSCARNAQENTSIQLFGAGPGLNGLVQGAYIEDMLITNGLRGSLDLMGIQNGTFRNIRIDNCGQGLYLWQNCNSNDFNGIQVTNNIACNSSVTNPGPCFTQSGTPGGGDGSNYNNRFTSSVFINSGLQCILNTGGSLIFDHCVIVGTQNATTSQPSGATIYSANATSTYVSDSTDTTLTNCVIGAFMLNGVASTYSIYGQTNPYNSLHGDYNVYFSYTTDAPSVANSNRFIGAINNSTQNGFATWQAAAAPMDAHSAFLPYGDPGFTSQFQPSIFTNNPPGYFGRPGQYMTPNGLNLMPFNDSTAPTTALQLVGTGLSTWQLNTLAPAAPVTGTSANASYTWNTGTWNFKITYVTLGGETLPGPATAQAVTSGTNGPTITAPANPPASAIGYNVYAQFSTVGGQYYKQNNVPIAIGSNWTSQFAPVVPNGAVITGTIAANGTSLTVNSTIFGTVVTGMGGPYFAGQTNSALTTISGSGSPWTVSGITSVAGVSAVIMYLTAAGVGWPYASQAPTLPPLIAPPGDLNSHTFYGTNSDIGCVQSYNQNDPALAS